MIRILVKDGQDYGMRIYDTRLGKFLSVDPIANSYPWYTPYQFAGNDVMRCMDPRWIGADYANGEIH